MSSEVDVVVVGGGPAGSTAATLMARAGHSVVQLEAQRHPRHQIGESLLPSTVHGVCKLLGVWDALHDMGFVRKRGGTFRWGAQAEPWTFAFSAVNPEGADYAFQVERARFDQLLFEQARHEGVDGREGIEVLGAELADNVVTGVKVRDVDGQVTVIRSRYVLDASGHGSRLARLAGRRIPSDFFRNVAVYGYFHNAGRLDPPNAGNVITAAFEGGWCWFIPLSDGLTSVGAVVDREQASRIRGDRAAALQHFVGQCPIVSEMLTNAVRVTRGMYGEVRVRKDWSYSNESYVAPGMLVAGDAACFVDPAFSSGVHLATYAGMLAARTINSILAGTLDERRCLVEYQRRYWREFSLFYDLLVAFYDMGQQWESYYWRARELLDTSERANDAFIRLVSGGATSPDDFFMERRGLGDALAAGLEMTGVESLRERERGGIDDAVGPSPKQREAWLKAPSRGALVEGLGRAGAQAFEDADIGSRGENGLLVSADRLHWLSPDAS